MEMYAGITVDHMTMNILSRQVLHVLTELRDLFAALLPPDDLRDVEGLISTLKATLARVRFGLGKRAPGRLRMMIVPGLIMIIIMVASLGA
jgi:hypothetical protein